MADLCGCPEDLERGRRRPQVAASRGVCLTLRTPFPTTPVGLGGAVFFVRSAPRPWARRPPGSPKSQTR
eukprot:3029319-Lingulodinium_polyedra.AAC.1